jgi:hypothetical protein
MFASLLIENYVSALIGLSENQCSRVGIVKRDGSCAPYQVAVLIGFEDVEGWNHVFKFSFLAGTSLGYRVRVARHERFRECVWLRPRE